MLAGAGVALAFVAKDTASPLGGPKQMTLAEGCALRDRANLEQTLALGFFVGAGVAAVASVIWAVSGPADSPRPILTLTNGGSAIALSCGF